MKELILKHKNVAATSVPWSRNQQHLPHLRTVQATFEVPWDLTVIFSKHCNHYGWLPTMSGRHQTVGFSLSKNIWV